MLTDQEKQILVLCLKESKRPADICRAMEKDSLYPYYSCRNLKLKGLLKTVIPEDPTLPSGTYYLITDEGKKALKK